jgi:hypothetical protein
MVGWGPISLCLLLLLPLVLLLALRRSQVRFARYRRRTYVIDTRTGQQLHEGFTRLLDAKLYSKRSGCTSECRICGVGFTPQTFFFHVDVEGPWPHASAKQVRVFQEQIQRLLRLEGIHLECMDIRIDYARAGLHNKCVHD